MTARQAYRKLRSLYYRQRLLEDLPALEQEILELVNETGLKALGNFKIEVQDGKIKLTRIEFDFRQLHFEFIHDEKGVS
jgi:uncharacterized membrane protein YgaE (UPF0421/DUF939 family)